MKEVYTTSEVAKLLGCCVRTVGKAIDSGAIKGWRISAKPGSYGHRRVSRPEVDKLLERLGLPSIQARESMKRLGGA